MFDVEGWKETEAMNALQENGVISDECVWWDDVANQETARVWLEEHRP